MNKLLSNLDSIEKGTFDGPVAQEKSEMKSILESLQTVNEGPIDMAPNMGAPSMPEPDKVTMNVNMNAQGSDAIQDLIKLMGGAAAPQDAPVRMPPMPNTGDDEMSKLKAIMTPKDEIASEEDYANEPDEEYADTQTMTKDLSGGLNREKKMHKPAAGGDNPMSVESIKESLWAALNEKKLTDKEVQLPTGKEMKKCSDDGMSKKEIMDKYKGCDKDKLEKLYASSCMN